MNEDVQEKKPEIGSPEWLESAGSFDPFSGDFGDGSARTLRDEVMIAKRSGPCREDGGIFDGQCGGVKKGEWTRVIKMADSEGFYGGRICVRCLDAYVAEEFPEDDEEHADAAAPSDPTTT